MHPVADAELGEHPRDVRLHRRLGQDRPGCDLGVRQPLDEQVEHLAPASLLFGLPLSQLGDSADPGAGRLALGALLRAGTLEQPPAPAREVAVLA